MENNSKRQKTFETADGERSERNVRKEQAKKKTTVTMATSPLMMGMSRGEQQSTETTPLPVMFVTMTHDMEIRMLHVSVFWFQ